MKIIDIADLHKTYRPPFRAKKFEALKGITLSVDQGEAFGFIGPNGAGKSTTIKILTGSVFSTAGMALMNGLPVTEASSRRSVGYVPENPYLYDFLTPMETLKLSCRLHGIKKDNLKKHCTEWLERFGISDVANKRIRGFSKGMTQRTALAASLALEPKLLILDEPLSGLDPIGRKDVVDILMSYRKEGGTIFFSSHVLHDVERLADRFGLIHKGELKTVQAPHELLGSEQRFSVRTVGDVCVDGMQSDVGNRWFAEVTQTQLWELLNRLERAGHQILEVKPSLSLETAFLQYVSAGS